MRGSKQGCSEHAAELLEIPMNHLIQAMEDSTLTLYNNYIFTHLYRVHFLYLFASYSRGAYFLSLCSFLVLTFL